MKNNTLARAFGVVVFLLNLSMLFIMFIALLPDYSNYQLGDYAYYGSLAIMLSSMVIVSTVEIDEGIKIRLIAFFLVIFLWNLWYILHVLKDADLVDTLLIINMLTGWFAVCLIEYPWYKNNIKKHKSILNLFRKRHSVKEG